MLGEMRPYTGGSAFIRLSLGALEAGPRSGPGGLGGRSLCDEYLEAVEDAGQAELACGVAGGRNGGCDGGGERGPQHVRAGPRRLGSQLDGLVGRGSALPHPRVRAHRQRARLTLQNAGEPNWAICAGPTTLTAQESGVPIRRFVRRGL